MVVTVEAVIVGHARPKGTLVRAANSRALYYPSEVRDWERQVRVGCAQAMQGRPLIRSKCAASLRFYITPTKGGKHPGRLRGDIDKLSRAILDAAKGVVIEDDELVVSLLATKMPVEPGHLERCDLSFSIAGAV